MEPDGTVRHAPGLLLEWRLGPGPKWHGLVAYVPVSDRGGCPTYPHLVQRWLPASCLTARP